MHDQKLTISHHEAVLANLKAYGFLADYRLAIYTRHQDPGGPGADRWHFLETADRSPLCHAFCSAALAPSLNTALGNGRHMLLRCPAGLPAFAVPLVSAPSAPPVCLVGCGVREESLHLPSIESLATTVDADPLDLLAHLQNLPVTTREELAEVARKVSNMVPSLQSAGVPLALIGKVTERLGAVVGVSAEIDRAETTEEAIGIMSEATGILFDIPEIAVAQAADNDHPFHLRGTWGKMVEAGNLAAGDVTRLFSPRPFRTVVLNEEECEEFFSRTGTATCLPLVEQDHVVGLVALFGTELQEGDLHLVELLAGRVASRVAQLKKDENQRRQNAASARYLAMISELALVEGTEELYRKIVEMAAELVQATCGSLMFLDDDGETLRIEAPLGMNPKLAKTLSGRVGTGIAGKVAASGHPLLVNDIEKDTRLATHNRPRFRTKSFVCVPLRVKERVIGVLNLSDKEHEGIYTEKDLETLLPFVQHAAILVERARAVARTELLEQLSVTDPLTELFNRRFLEKRLEEELNRARRHGLQLTLMMIDLDGFKLYNDLHGHPAGDKALKRTARVLRASVREMDLVTRYGGEEFCIVLPDTAKKESLFVADRIRRGIEKEPFPGEASLPAGRLTTSVGIASFPEDGDTPFCLTRAADTALYQAKAAGRNRIVFASPTPPGGDQKPLQQKDAAQG